MDGTKITISYPSGKRTQLVRNKLHQALCKTFCKSENVEQTVISLLVKEKPREVVDAAAKVVSEEARELCKRNSNSILMKKDQESLMSFTWDKFNKELEIRAPNVLRIYPLGLTDCNENKTAEMIKMLKEFQQKYVPFKNEDICESVFFDGDRLRDERIQSSQQAMLNAESPAGRLEGFISKIEDFHTLMNFLEVNFSEMVYISKEGDNFFYHRIKNETFYGVLMIAFGAIVLVLVLYLIIKMCACDDDDEHISKGPQLFPGNPIFAHELTPGTIVLQSANGEYFRILQEYSSTHNDNTSCRTDRSSTFAYPDTSRVRMEHERLQRTPTAPAFDNDMVTNTHNPVMIQPPPYNSTWG